MGDSRHTLHSWNPQYIKKFLMAVVGISVIISLLNFSAKGRINQPKPAKMVTTPASVEAPTEYGPDLYIGLGLSISSSVFIGWFGPAIGSDHPRSLLSTTEVFLNAMNFT
ncbi:uncharacterized protein LOC135195800 [Macrobrachium nipponense]|uniref:uncharacterized protein LOC135195800 n=1 Tax=Macrobrachium nipponense TaxID=159736 RepID=UPI0030C7AFB7